MAWVRCCGGAQSVKPVAVVLSGRLQSGFSITGNGLSQQTSALRVTRSGSTNGGDILLNKQYTGYSGVQITASTVTPASLAYLRVAVLGKFVDLSTDQTKTIALNPDTDIFDRIALTMYNYEGTGNVITITLIP